MRTFHQKILFKYCFVLLLIIPLSDNSITASTFDFSDEQLQKKKEVIVIHDAQKDLSEKEALIILPGFGDSRKGRKHQESYFSDVGYDLYIPDFADRKSFTGTLENFTNFYYEKNLDEYKKVHVFSYIMGSWVINTFINIQGKQNISTIVYDRSPLQERAPKLLADKLRIIGLIAVGQVLVDLSEIEYPPIEKQDINIGIIVESKATLLMKILKKPALSYGKLKWDEASFNQPHDDLMYTRLNHDQMYVHFEVIGEDILSFLKFGRFTNDARRTPYDWNIFERYKSVR